MEWQIILLASAIRPTQFALKSLIRLRPSDYDGQAHFTVNHVASWPFGQWTLEQLDNGQLLHLGLMVLGMANYYIGFGHSAYAVYSEFTRRSPTKEDEVGSRCLPTPLRRPHGRSRKRLVN